MQEDMRRCDLCGGEMRLVELDKAQWGERRYRYECPDCGAHTRRARYASEAKRTANVRRPETRYTREPVRCPYYKRHCLDRRTITCEAPVHGARTMTIFFDAKKALLMHMQRACRRGPESCEIAQTLARLYDKKPGA